MTSVEQSRVLFDRGCYPQCIELLRSLLASGASAEVVAELAQVYLFLGYANEAVEVLRDATFVSDHGMTAQSRLKNMLDCFAKCLQSATFHDVLDAADRIYQQVPQTASDANLDPEDILTVAYYCRLLGLAAVSQASRYQKQSEPIAFRLRLIFDHLQNQQNGRLAFKVAMAMYPPEGKVKALSALIDQPHVSQIVRAKAQIELANTLNDPTESSRRDELYRSAQESIGSLHTHVSIDIAVEQWAAKSADLAAAPILDINHARRVYEKLDYINGLKNLTHKQLDDAALQHDHELQADLERQLTSLSAKGGLMLTWAMYHVNLIQRFSLWSGNEDMVWNAALTADQQIRNYELPYEKGKCAYVLCEMAMRRGDIVAALGYSSKCQTEWSQCSNASRSISDTLRARAELQHLRATPGSASESLREWLMESADRDVQDCLNGEAITKLELLLDSVFSKHHVDSIARRTATSGLIERIQGILEGYTEPDKNNRFANLFQSKGVLLVSEGSTRTDCELELQAFQAFQEALKFYSKDAKDKPTFQTTTTKLQMGLLAHAIFAKQQTVDKSTAKQILNSSIALFVSCIGDSTMLGQPAWIRESEYWVALTKYEAAISGVVSVEDALDAIAAAERGFDEKRNEISVTKGIGAVQAKQFLAKDKHVRDIYRFAFQLCLLVRKDEISAWEWVQKAKARSLSDTIGLGAVVPASLQNSISSDPEALSMFQEEQRLIEELQQSDATQRFYKTIDLRKYRTKMRDQPSLRALIELREGAALTSKMLKEACADRSTGLASQFLLFVDWYIKGDEIHLLIHPSDGPPQRRLLGISASEVQLWVTEHLRTREGRLRSVYRDENHPSQPLRALDVLIEPLADFSEVGQVLILSPSGPLEAVPLHALRLPVWTPGFNPKRPCLIERNPILYCANATAFVQCCRAALAKDPSRGYKASVYSVYEPFEDAIYEEGEQHRAYEAAKQLASQLQCTATLGQNATATNLRTDWPQCDFIYFHGHCDPSPDIVTDQSLIMATDESSKSHAVESSQSHHSYKVAEFFDLKLRSPHISLMACGSASQKISAGDEPLGILTALLCAGAASIVGTMWPVASASARKFAGLFQSELFDVNTSQQRDSIEGSGVEKQVVNLAVALQKAVIRMKRHRDSRLPYHWAPFVLHGSCFMQRPKEWSSIAE